MSQEMEMEIGLPGDFEQRFVYVNPDGVRHTPIKLRFAAALIALYGGTVLSEVYRSRSEAVYSSEPVPVSDVPKMTEEEAKAVMKEFNAPYFTSPTDDDPSEEESNSASEQENVASVSAEADAILQDDSRAGQEIPAGTFLADPRDPAKSVLEKREVEINRITSRGEVNFAD